MSCPLISLRGFLDPQPTIAVGQCILLVTWCCLLRYLSVDRATLAINATWFGAAFVAFGVIPHAALDWVVPRRAEKEDTYVVVESAMRFLGGMNAPMMLLSAFALYASFGGFDEKDPPFSSTYERKLLFVTFSAAHFSQFIFNVPAFFMRYEYGRQVVRRVAKAGILPRRFHRFANEPVWPRPDQTILLIFLFDGLFFLLNLYCSEQSA